MKTIFYFDDKSDNLFIGKKEVEDDYILESNETEVILEESPYLQVYFFNKIENKWITKDPIKYTLKLDKMS